MKMKKISTKQDSALAVLVLLVSVYMTVGSAKSQAAGKPDAPSNPVDPCVLVTTADLQATLGIALKLSAQDDNGESRKCEYQDTGQNWLVQIYTGNSERSEFQNDSKRASSRNATWGKASVINNITAPAYRGVGEGRLIVWKNNIAVTVGIQEITFTKGDDVLQGAREKLANIALSRMK
jgi:hypothetical protein